MTPGSRGWKATRQYEPAAAIEPALHRIPHRGRMIFGMGAGHDHQVVLEKTVAFAMQIFIGDHVVIDVLAIEPVEEMRIGIVLPQCRAMAAEP
jgi:hypothetical protein